MDEQKNSYPGVYQRAKDRLEYEEAMTLRDTEARERDAEERAAREKAELQKPDGEYTSINKAAGLAREETESLTMNGEDDPSSRVTRLATLSVTFAPEPNFMRPPRWNQYMLERRAWEADGLDALHSHLRDVSLSNGSHSTGHIRSVIRKSRSKIFGIRPVQENEDVPTMTKQSFVSRAAISLFSNSVDKREHPSVTSGRSFSAPIDQGPTGPRRVRDLQMEEAAKAMGFVLDTNRFGFQEIFIGGGTVPTQIQEAMSTADDPSISDVEDDYTDDEGTVFGECDTEVLSENQEAFHTPPCSTKVPAPATQHGLGDVEDSQSDSLSWLDNAFSPSTLDLMRDFGTPPRAETNSPQSSSTFTMGDEARKGMYNFDIPPKIGDFGTYGGEQVSIGNTTKYCAKTTGLVEDHEVLGHEVVAFAKALCEAKDPITRGVIAHNLAALTKAEALDAIMKSCCMSLEEAEELLEHNNAFNAPNKSRGAQQTPTKTGSSNSAGSFGGKSSGKQPSHKNPRSKEGGFFKSLIGTTEPSLAAWEQLQQRSLMEANADLKDPDLAAKLKVSSRKLPPEAPKPASKEPVPKVKSGASNILRRFSSMDNLKRKDTKSFGMLESKNYSARNASQQQHSSQSKDASLTSISEELTGISRSPEEASPRSFNSSLRALDHDNQANINEDVCGKLSKLSTPSRSPLPLPIRPRYYVEKEVQEEQDVGAEEPTTPQHLNINKSLPGTNFQDVEWDVQVSRDRDIKRKEWVSK